MDLLCFGGGGGGGGAHSLWALLAISGNNALRSRSKVVVPHFWAPIMKRLGHNEEVVSPAAGLLTGNGGCGGCSQQMDEKEQPTEHCLMDADVWPGCRLYTGHGSIADKMSLRGDEPGYALLKSAAPAPLAGMLQLRLR